MSVPSFRNLSSIHNHYSLAFNQFPQSPLDGVYWRLFRAARPEVNEGIESGPRMKDRFQVPGFGCQKTAAYRW
jgi:hypothetical protein